MIVRLYLEGFKSFQDPTHVDCCPITVFTGSNSSGKSSLIQSILLQKQLADPDRSGTGRNSIVRLNGDLVSPGSFRELSWAHKGESLKVGIRFADQRASVDLRLELEERRGGLPDDARLQTVALVLKRQPSHRSRGVELSWSASLESSAELAKELFALLGGRSSSPTETTSGREKFSAERPYSLELSGEIGSSALQGSSAGCSLRGLHPNMIQHGANPVNAARWLTSVCETCSADPATIEDLFQPWTLADRFDRVYYLGPLRDNPRSLYTESRGSSATEIGLHGAGAASALAEYGEQMIEMPRLDLSGESTAETLAEGVRKWAAHIGVVADLNVNRTRHGTELHVSTSNSPAASPMSPLETALTNVGIGVSQILPVIVLGLAAPLGSTIILEQPELHLHPSVQSRLADFFAGCALSGRQLIIETHSEHLINRFRLLVARGQLRGDTDISLNFIERDKYGSELSPIAIHADGSLARWPKGFFDETQRALDELLKERLR